MENKIELIRTYRSEAVGSQPKIKYDKNTKKRPSWVKLGLDKKIIFIKLAFNGESFWYRRYFQDYFFIFDPNSEDYRAYYNEIAEDYESYVPQNKAMRKIVLDFLKKLKIDKKIKILDLGAGTGIVTEGIAEKGYTNLTLLDISDKELEIAKKKKSLRGADYQIVDLTKEEIGGKYDLIFETMSLDYFKGEKMKLILQKIKDALKGGGKFIVIDRHIYPEFNIYFKRIEEGKIELETPEGLFDYFYFIGEK